MKKTFMTILLIAFVQLISFAQTSEEKEVAAAVEKLRVALLDGTEPELNRITSPLLSYGHSNGLLEDKKEFIRALTSGESNFTKIEISDQTITVSGDVAMVRHKLVGETANKGKEQAQVKLGVFYVWQKTKGEWLLVGRQAFKLPM